MKSLYISLPSSLKEQFEMTGPNHGLSGELETRQLISLFFFVKSFALSQIQFRDSFDTEEQSK